VALLVGDERRSLLSPKSNGLKIRVSAVQFCPAPLAKVANNQYNGLLATFRLWWRMGWVLRRIYGELTHKVKPRVKPEITMTAGKKRFLFPFSE